MVQYCKIIFWLDHSQFRDDEIFSPRVGKVLNLKYQMLLIKICPQTSFFFIFMSFQWNKGKIMNTKKCHGLYITLSLPCYPEMDTCDLLISMDSMNMFLIQQHGHTPLILWLHINTIYWHALFIKQFQHTGYRARPSWHVGSRTAVNLSEFLKIPRKTRTRQTQLLLFLILQLITQCQ